MGGTTLKDECPRLGQWDDKAGTVHKGCGGVLRRVVREFSLSAYKQQQGGKAWYLCPELCEPALRTKLIEVNLVFCLRRMAAVTVARQQTWDWLDQKRSAVGGMLTQTQAQMLAASSFVRRG